MATMRHSRSGLARLVRRIQELTLELEELREQRGADQEIEAKERTREELRWQLVAVVRRTAANGLEAAPRQR
jgi:hypothetical protein